MKFIKFLFLTLSISCSSINTNQPKPLIHTDTLFIGHIEYGDTVKTQLKLLNPNKQDIKIESLISSCGCVLPNLRDSIIKGYDSTIIKIIYTPSTNADSGNILKTISIRANSNPPFRSVILKGFVKKISND
jgi:hypothetical protein